MFGSVGTDLCLGRWILTYVGRMDSDLCLGGWALICVWEGRH